MNGAKHDTGGLGSAPGPCPVTGKPWSNCWSDPDRDNWPHNVCDQCAPDEYVSVAERLEKLNKARS